MLAILYAVVLATPKLQDSSTPILIREGLVVGGVMAGGRLPFGIDSVQQQVVQGRWQMPKEGDTLPNARGGTARWRHVTAGKDGSFNDLPSGYLAASVNVSDDCTKVLQATGDTLVYVNGAPRAGDPYSYGYLKAPIHLRKGENTFLFAVGRGGLNAQILPVRAPIQIETGDLTSPDVLIAGPKELWVGVVLLNTTKSSRHVQVVSRNSSDETATVPADIPAMSFRKIPTKLIVPDGDLGKEQRFLIECADGGITDHATISLPVKRISETHRETFLSGIDGSLQYFAVCPSQKPSNKDALVLTLHGAGVEAINQAWAYVNKDWCTIVAPTNRRPYGFDWEDIGRLDALEVLDHAKKEFSHDPESVHLTGHSMGGHGTWSIGTLYPDLFASVAPSAGWISFWSYAGGYRPTSPTPVEADFLRAMSPSDTLARVENTLEEKLYVLHGDQDDNVPVAQAREMKKVLTSIHADFVYHEQPGAGHWWGNQCVDWPGIFDQIRATRLTPRTEIDFTTPNPAVSSHDEWVTVLEQEHPMAISHVKIGGKEGQSENIHALRLDRAIDDLTLDGQHLGRIQKGSELIRVDGRWKFARVNAGDKSPRLSGPFKNVYQNDFVFVVGTHGNAEENRWAMDKARYDAETFEYRGNGSIDIVSDSRYNPEWQRNVVLYGNAETNSAWKPLLGRSPIQVTRDRIAIGTRAFSGSNLAALFVFPHRARGAWFLVGAVSGSGIEGMRTTDRLAIFTSGVAYPDWTVLSSDVLSKGSKGVRGCGFFDNSWRLSDADSAWNP